MNLLASLWVLLQICTIHVSPGRSRSTSQQSQVQRKERDGLAPMGRAQMTLILSERIRILHWPETQQSLSEIKYSDGSRERSMPTETAQSGKYWLPPNWRGYWPGGAEVGYGFTSLQMPLTPDISGSHLDIHSFFRQTLSDCCVLHSARCGA